jgi:putative DNA-binding protein
MTGAMSIGLAALQDQFQEALLSGDDRVLSVIRDSHRERRDVLLGVYRHAYTERLVEFVENDHELLHKYLGNEAFGEMAQAYAAAYPSQDRNARYFCSHLPPFLRTVEPYKSQPELSELAALEKALNDAFDATDAPVLTLIGLGRLPPEDWSRLTFKPHPSATRLDCFTNAADIWLALKEELEPPKLRTLAEPSRILTWRQDIPKFRLLGAEEAMMWDEAARGAKFETLCELVAIFGGLDGAEERAAGYLQGWISSGLLTEPTWPFAEDSMGRQDVEFNYGGNNS